MNKILHTIQIAIIYSLTVIFCASCTVSSVPTRNIVYSADNTPIFYQSVGSGPITLVFVHGWSCNSTYWNKQVNCFKDKYQVVTIDLAGHGLSGKTTRKNYSVELFAADVNALLQQIDSPVILIGHSMAGEVIMQAALTPNEKIKAIIGVDTLQDLATTVTTEQTDQFLQMFAGDFKVGAYNFVSSMFGENDDQQLKEKIIYQMSASTPRIAVNTLANYFQYYTSGKAKDAAAKTTTPLYCINSELWPTNVEGNASVFPNYNPPLFIKNSGHFIMLTNSEEFNSKLQELIDRISKSDPKK